MTKKATKNNMQLIIKNIYENQSAGVENKQVPGYHHHILYVLFPV
jgi:hypothetical protein